MFWYSRPYDKKLRRNFSRTELNRLKFMYFFVLPNLSLMQKRYCLLKFNRSSLSKLSFITKIQTRCVITLRSKAVYNKFKLSRLQLKKYGSNGLLMGLRKSMW